MKDASARSWAANRWHLSRRAALSLLLVFAAGFVPASVAPAGGSAVPARTQAQRAEVVRDLLDERTAAVASHDAARWTATVNPVDPDFTARQDALFATLVGLPLAALTYSYAGVGPALDSVRARELGPGAFTAKVRLRYRLAEADHRDVQRDHQLTITRFDGRWLVADDVHPGGVGRTQLDPWDLGSVDVARGRFSIVLSRPGAAGLSDPDRAGRAGRAGLAGLADRAVEQVQELWRGPWPGRVVVIMPVDVGEMAQLIGEHGPGGVAGLAQMAAVTTGQPAGEPGGVTTGNRIVVNPDVFAALTETGRRVVLAHEATHVATRTLGGAPVQSWLAEGFADYVAYRGAGTGVEKIAGDLLAQVRAGIAPVQLPAEVDFHVNRGPVSASYSLAWLAVRHIAQTHGEARLVELYLTAAAGPTTGAGTPQDPAAATDAALGEVLGVSMEEFREAWGDAVVDAAGPAVPGSGTEQAR